MHGIRVIVAGAGLAGLTAAHELAAAGAAVTILDARERPGGRVWTVRDGFTEGQHGELGGEFVDEHHERMRALAARFNLPLVRVLRGGFTHRFRTGDGDIRVSRAGPWQELEELLAPLIRRYKAARGDDEAETIRELSTYSLRDWLDRREASPEVHAMVNSMRGFFLADPEELSVLPVVAQLAESGSPAQTPVYRIAGGADRLITALVANTPARLLLGHRLCAIAQPVDRVIARVTDERGVQQEIEADFLVAALPASTLRDVQIAPPLDETQRHAIARLSYGRATKLVIQCDAAGLAGRRAQAFATDGAIGAFWDATAGGTGLPQRQRRGGGTSVINFLAGGSASQKLRERARHGAGYVLSDLCWLGMAGAPVITSHTATWEDDALARGGYAYADPAFDPAWRPLLSRRAGRLLFAGEHTSTDFQGYMEGAVESGQRAAAELIRGS